MILVSPQVYFVSTVYQPGVLFRGDRSLGPMLVPPFVSFRIVWSAWDAFLRLAVGFLCVLCVLAAIVATALDYLITVRSARVVHLAWAELVSGLWRTSASACNIFSLIRVFAFWLLACCPSFQRVSFFPCRIGVRFFLWCLARVVVGVWAWVPAVSG